MRDPAPGTHAILWSDDSAACDQAIETFIRGGVERGDMIMVIFPREELADVQGRLRARGTDLDSLVDQGHLFRAVAEEAGPRGTDDVTRVSRDAFALREFARTVGKNGMTIVGRTAAVFFDRGDPEMAKLIERAQHESRGNSRILCVYSGRNLRAERLSGAVALTKMHTHALTSVGGGKFFIESVPREAVIA
jgi:hypothetical protein